MPAKLQRVGLQTAVTSLAILFISQTSTLLLPVSMMSQHRDKVLKGSDFNRSHKFQFAVEQSGRLQASQQADTLGWLEVMLAYRNAFMLTDSLKVLQHPTLIKEDILSGGIVENKSRSYSSITRLHANKIFINQSLFQKLLLLTASAGTLYIISDRQMIDRQMIDR